MKALILVGLLFVGGCASVPEWYADGEHDVPSCRVSRPPCALGSTGRPDPFWAMRRGMR
jgi:hypothetical protein